MFSPTQIAAFLACPHTATLDRAEARHEIKKPFFKNASIDLLQKLGLEHEQQYLRKLTEQNGLVVVRVDGSWENAAAQTLRALQDGAAAIYQAAFLYGNWGGR